MRFRKSFAEVYGAIFPVFDQQILVHEPLIFWLVNDGILKSWLIINPGYVNGSYNPLYNLKVVRFFSSFGGAPDSIALEGDTVRIEPLGCPRNLGSMVRINGYFTYL